MYDHNNHDSKMMWLMVIGCLLLAVVFIGLSSGIAGFALGSNWPWLIFVLLFIGLHVGMLFHGHGNDDGHRHNDSQADRNKK